MPSSCETALRERLGKYATGAGPDVRALAAQVEGERLEVAVVAMSDRRGWIVAATDRGLRWSRRPRLLGRGRDERRDWDALGDVRVTPMGLTLRFGDEDVTFSFAGPDDEARRLVEVARARLGAERPDVEELRALARTKLGGKLAWTYGDTIAALPDRLESGERVERLAVATHGFTGLLALTDRRLLLLATGLRARSERQWSVARTDLEGAEPTEHGLRLAVPGGLVELTGIQPADRRDELAVVLARGG